MIEFKFEREMDNTLIIYDFSKFRKDSGRIYHKLVELNLDESSAEKWFYRKNSYLDNRTPYELCKEKKYNLVLKVAKDEISRLEWVVNS